MKTQFTDRELSKALSTHEGQAEKIVSDKSEWVKFVEKARKWLEGKKSVPVIGSVIDDVLTMIDLVTDHVNGVYLEVPASSIIAIATALIYLVSPIDLIPDFIPVAGLMDDVAVVLFVLHTGVGNDLKKYRAWKAEKLQAQTTVLADLEEKRIAEKVAGRPLVCAFYDDKEQNVGFIIAESGDSELPIDSSLEKVSISNGVLEIMQEPEIIMQFYQDILDGGALTWSALGPKPLVMKEELERYGGMFYLEAEED